ncbi:hypothetical protein LR48_Vigan04g183000 [Vigna angularis]|uniref:Uncharacterized protein n=1 Tax=Phaseolus angularis TaxID=3914 RepID=A0A0L9UGE4_PHAAN|nr:hypothetical protein LR48_Vigan04g183000 [Vigna angularis]
MSMQYSCSSSTCNECRKKFRSVSCRVDDRKDASLICHCGEKSVLRTAKTNGPVRGELTKVLAVRCWKQMMRGC